MTDPNHRLRTHPDQRFQSPQHQIELAAIADKLLAEPLPDNRRHRQETLYRHGPLTLALFLFEKDASLPQHTAAGTVTIHVLAGRLRISAESQSHDLPQGSLLVLAPGIQHDLLALEPTRMLLTVCLEPR